MGIVSEVKKGSFLGPTMRMLQVVANNKKTKDKHGKKVYKPKDRLRWILKN